MELIEKGPGFKSGIKDISKYLNSLNVLKVCPYSRFTFFFIIYPHKKKKTILSTRFNTIIKP